VRLAAVLVVAAIAVGCAGDGGGEAEGPSTDLRISVSETGSGSTFTTTVTCTEDVTTSAETCRRLAALDHEAFAPVPPNTACAEIYGGPQVAEVRGMLEGGSVDATFNRTDACEIARWNRVSFLFPTR
jgi:hypothetical protein